MQHLGPHLERDVPMWQPRLTFASGFFFGVLFGVLQYVTAVTRAKGYVVHVGSQRLARGCSELAQV
jgi:hypothetical protein